MALCDINYDDITIFQNYGSYYTQTTGFCLVAQRQTYKTLQMHLRIIAILGNKRFMNSNI